MEAAPARSLLLPEGAPPLISSTSLRFPCGAFLTTALPSPCSDSLWWLSLPCAANLVRPEPSANSLNFSTRPKAGVSYLPPPSRALIHNSIAASARRDIALQECKLVPGKGLEPSRLTASASKTDVSAMPPPGQVGISAKLWFPPRRGQASSSRPKREW